MKDVTTLDLIRHGEPVGGRLYRGHRDDPLSERGWEQMWHAVRVPAPWVHIVTSPLRRCSEFALRLGEHLGLPVSAEPRLREVAFGAWEGRTAEELRRADPEVLARFYRDPVHQRPADAEPLAQFRGRVIDTFAELMERHQGGHILVVTHAGVMRALVAHVLDAPLAALYRVHVDNASLTRVQQTGERPLSLFFHGRRGL
jgi:alpha-ribazole phosphatase/probable phosphoglycerate mutase